jgi:hypothetical protein
MTVQLRFPSTLITPARYKIHVKPVNLSDPGGACSESSTGGVFAQNDLASLFEPIGASPYSLVDSYDVSRQLQLNGDTSIVGRAIVIYNGITIPVACATIIGQPRIEAMSTFNTSQVTGFIR